MKSSELKVGMFVVLTKEARAAGKKLSIASDCPSAQAAAAHERAIVVSEADPIMLVSEGGGELLTPTLVAEDLRFDGYWANAVQLSTALRIVKEYFVNKLTALPHELDAIKSPATQQSHAQWTVDPELLRTWRVIVGENIHVRSSENHVWMPRRLIAVIDDKHVYVMPDALPGSDSSPIYPYPFAKRVETPDSPRFIPAVPLHTPRRCRARPLPTPAQPNPAWVYGTLVGEYIKANGTICWVVRTGDKPNSAPWSFDECEVLDTNSLTTTHSCAHELIYSNRR